MPTLSFTGDTHDEIVAQVRRWLSSLQGEDRHLSPVEAVNAAANLTKEALRVIAAAAPAPVAESDVVKALTEQGFKATEATRNAVVQSLDSLSSLTGGGLVKRARDAQANAIWEMNQTVAKQILKGIRSGRK